MDKEILSVIIPIYNVENFLRQCLDSLVMQTNTNFHVVLVNDGSVDASASIAKEYCEKYKEMFSYYEQENKGQGAARNLGLKYVRTPYVTFLDSDDWWKPRNMESIIRAIQECDADPDLIFTCPSVYDMATNGYSDWRDNDYIKSIFSKYGRVLSPRIITELYSTEASVCRVVVKTDILRTNDFQFPEGIKWEDVFPHFAILNWAQRCILVEEAGFVYRINSGKQTTGLSDRRRLDIVPAFAAAFGYALDKQWAPVELASIFSMLMNFISWFLKATSKETYPALIKYLHTFAVVLPNECFKYYIQFFCPPRKHVVLWRVLRSKVFYRVLLSPYWYDFFKRIYFKMQDWRK